MHIVWLSAVAVGPGRVDVVRPLEPGPIHTPKSVFTSEPGWADAARLRPLMHPPHRYKSVNLLGLPVLLTLSSLLSLQQRRHPLLPSLQSPVLPAPTLLLFIPSKDAPPPPVRSREGRDGTILLLPPSLPVPTLLLLILIT
jgi:hypothetical protein